MNIGFFGSSLLSSYWNGAATYYRGLLKAMAGIGHRITFYEPDAYDRQKHLDMPPPAWARVVVYPATNVGWQSSLATAARESDLLVKASGVGVFDAELEQALPDAAKPGSLCAIWDVDAPATLEAVAADPGHHLPRVLPRYDVVFTYGGGNPVVRGYEAIGARRCVPIYNALDPDTHHPVAARAELGCDLSFLGNRLPDRESRVEHFFLDVAARLPRRSFLLGGSGWHDKLMPTNVRHLGHVGTADHNAFFCSGLATLNINRDSMARYGFSPPTRVFEAAGAGACLITDAWNGIDQFLEPDREVLVAASGEEVVTLLSELTSERARRIAEAGRRRILAHHTYTQRAREVQHILDGMAVKGEAAE
ncbi:glycosyltransferase [Xanthobacteraceae bacterium Astr-EGSB]|uniref:CgeB family protein n=1 Tax=Astrobacterium formosum TaxID=3069710 RepID=UPI0027B70D63|nr:glycosyltransferase [Xanthobacteraceae bacterium Astr-EGSB]